MSRSDYATPVAPPSPDDAIGSSRAGAACRIVLVEDNDDGREMLAAVLEASGHQVEVAADGIAGLDLVLASRPQVAFIDIGLPGIDGYEVARRVRAAMGAGSAGASPRIALVALTGYGQPDDVRQAREAGFDRHLVKPVDGAALDAVVEQLAISPAGPSSG